MFLYLYVAQACLGLVGQILSFRLINWTNWIERYSRFNWEFWQRCCRKNPWTRKSVKIIRSSCATASKHLDEYYAFHILMVSEWFLSLQYVRVCSPGWLVASICGAAMKIGTGTDQPWLTIHLPVTGWIFIQYIVEAEPKASENG